MVASRQVRVVSAESSCPDDVQQFPLIAWAQVFVGTRGILCVLQILASQSVNPKRVCRGKTCFANVRLIRVLGTHLERGIYLLFSALRLKIIRCGDSRNGGHLTILITFCATHIIDSCALNYQFLACTTEIVLMDLRSRRLFYSSETLICAKLTTPRKWSTSLGTGGILSWTPSIDYTW